MASALADEASPSLLFSYSPIILLLLLILLLIVFLIILLLVILLFFFEAAETKRKIRMKIKIANCEEE
jgi:hypothetical protein